MRKTLTAILVVLAAGSLAACKMPWDKAETPPPTVATGPETPATPPETPDPAQSASTDPAPPANPGTSPPAAPPTPAQK